MLKIIHDFNDPRRIDSEGRLILIRPNENKSENDELVEGMHVIIDDDTVHYEAILELVEQFTSDGLVDTWRARILPGSIRYDEPETDEKKRERVLDIIRIGDVYFVSWARPEEKGRWDRTKEKVRNRWDTYLFLRRDWNILPDKIETALNEADRAWYIEHKRRRVLMEKHRRK